MDKRAIEKVAGPKGHLIKSLHNLREGTKRVVAELQKMEANVSKEVMASGAIIAQEFNNAGGAKKKAPAKKGAAKKKAAKEVAAVLSEMAMVATPAKKSRKPKGYGKDVEPPAMVPNLGGMGGFLAGSMPGGAYMTH